ALVGRFGVGFAAVRAVADEVRVRSTTGAVRFSLAETEHDLDLAAADVPRLADEVARREGSLPALRLPREDTGRPPEGYDTAVELTLRDDDAVDRARSMLAEVGDALLLALPGLTEIVVEDDLAGRRRRVTDVDRRWRRLTAEGELDPALVADRPVEERGRRGWRVTWALPRSTGVDDVAGWARVVHAPTPTDDPLDLPALLVATLPLDATRRHVARGGATDVLLDVAAELYARLAEQCAADGEDALRLVPRGLPAGALDGALRERLLTMLSRTPILPAAVPEEPAGTAATGRGPVDGRDDGWAGGTDDAPGTADLDVPVRDVSGTPGRGDRLPGDGVPGDLWTGDRASDFLPGDRTGGGLPGDGVPGDRTSDRLPIAGGPGAGGAGRVLVAPHRAMALAGDEGPLARALAPWLSGLVTVSPGGLAAARSLGVEVRDLADVVDELPAAEGLPVARWRALYAALAPVVADPVARESLAGLPVPLADGRVVRGARGLLLPSGVEAGDVADATAVLGRWGVRVVHPAAVHDVLERLGAVPADPAVLLAHPGVRQAVLDQADEDDLALAAEVSDAVLTLVRAATADSGAAADDAEPVGPERAVLGLLTLRAADGEPTPAHGLVLPGSDAQAMLDPRVLAPVDPDEVDRWGAAALVAVGVRAGLVAVRVPDVVASEHGSGAGLLGIDDPVADLVADSLDGWEDYLAVLAEHLGEGAGVEEAVAVADLDAVDPDAWPRVLARLAGPGTLRHALLDPVRSPDGPGAAPSYTAWWLRQRAGLALDVPFAVAGADLALTRLLPPAPAAVVGLDASVQQALGGVDRLSAVPGDAWGRLLRAAAPVGGAVDPAVAGAVWAAWAELAEDDSGADAGGAGEDRDIRPGSRTRPGSDPLTWSDGRRGPDAVSGSDALAGVDVLPALVAPDRVVLVHAEDAAVAPSPMWWQRTDVAAMLPARGVAAAAVADLLDLPLATDLADGAVDLGDGDDAGELAPTPDAALLVLPGAPATWVEHETLRVDGVPVDWWVEGVGADAVVHAVHLAALARGLAQAAGAWSARHVLELTLTEPARAATLATEQIADPHPV
ncbi:MAG TPA: hypothetical protein VGC57_00975, partial [Cellulomonas sp.]